jgi:hypothetical protein
VTTDAASATTLAVSHLFDVLRGQLTDQHQQRIDPYVLGREQREQFLTRQPLLLRHPRIQTRSWLGDTNPASPACHHRMINKYLNSYPQGVLAGSSAWRRV